MIKTEFSTTAMSRPDLVNRTYESFCSQLLDVDYENSTLYLNVDPVPADTDPMAVVDVAKKYFGNVVHRIPEEANFASAVQWCWSQVKGKHLFHLEDDWILRRKIHFQEMITLLKSKHQGKKIIQVFLRRSKSINHDKICLAPSLLDGDFVRTRSAMFNTSLNPEIQLRGKLGGVSVNFATDITVHDIGREWLRSSGYQRPKIKRDFTKWIPKS